MTESDSADAASAGGPRRILRPAARWAGSFRGRIVVIVLLVAIAPLGVLGFWLARSAERSGESLLRNRLQASLTAAESQIGGRWLSRRSALLDVAQWVADSLLSDTRAGPAIPSWLDGRLDGVARIDVIGAARDSIPLRFAETGGEDGAWLRVSVPIHDARSGNAIGTLRADVDMASLLPRNDIFPAAAGVVLAVLDAESLQPIFPVPFDAGLLGQSRFQWAGETWITERSLLAEPEAILVATSPVAPFEAPFQDASRRGRWILLVVAASGVLLTLFVTRGLTRSVEQLATAADAVAAGDLDRVVPATGPQEVARLARGFNTMTESLRRTLGEVAERRAQAAAGEFAASLAHEVRNPLTAIRLDMQLVEEQMAADSPMRPIQERALAEVVRLDRTVGDALRKAGDGGLGTRTLDVRDPLRRAVLAATAAFTERGLSVPTVPEDDEVLAVRGEPGALEQLFLNLLLNAAQALPGGGTVSIHCERQAHSTLVRIRDTGAGIPPEAADRVFQPFFSTRADGTGLGLTIAQRIARAHGGELSLESAPGQGTTATVHLPAVG